MAAILCTTFGELISKCCSALTIPCQACGRGCDEIGKLFCTPFAPYIVGTFFLNTPAVVYAIKSAPNFECSYSLFRWLVVNAAFSVAHMIAAMYIVNLIKDPSNMNSSAAVPVATATISATTGLKQAEEGIASNAVASSTNSNNNFYALDDPAAANVPGGANSFKRIKHVLCYDKGMAIYIMVFLSWVVWMAIGVSRRLFFDDFNDNGDCDEMLHYMNASIAIGYVWMAIVGMTFCCSLLCLN
mmetsp:Transcript_6996/g.14887  ORF Transcript_6996/g.14887 Transcript_6996/m.14887 type:complete len:243 (+) Transcript_6996:218-946(+)